MEMAENKNDHVVIAIFNGQDAAKQAIQGLQSWDDANEDIKLGAIGTIYKDGDKIKTHVGRKTGSGAKVGSILGVIAAVLSGGVTLIAGVAAGLIGGGAIGSFFKKSMHMTKEEVEALGPKLDAGHVAVVVTL